MAVDFRYAMKKPSRTSSREPDPLLERLGERIRNFARSPRHVTQGARKGR